VGAYYYTNFLYRGKVYLHLGTETGLYSAAATTVEGAANGDDFGVWVGPAGDVNRDGYADVLVGAKRYDTPSPGTETGTVYLYLGTSSGMETNATSAIDRECVSELYSLRWLSSAGDVTGTGIRT